jgi:hypothetical protein
MDKPYRAYPPDGSGVINYPDVGNIDNNKDKIYLQFEQDIQDEDCPWSGRDDSVAAIVLTLVMVKLGILNS